MVYSRKWYSIAEVQSLSGINPERQTILRKKANIKLRKKSFNGRTKSAYSQDEFIRLLKEASWKQINNQMIYANRYVEFIDNERSE